jgi:Zn-dependent M28 family amino/carboxypeptidase
MNAKDMRLTVTLTATGEEVGLWGTDYYLAHPVVPLERTVLNLNFEMLGRPDPLVGGAGFTWLTGFERSNLGTMFREHGLEILADPYPEQHFFERSDNIAFVKLGIVGQTLSSYNLHTDYHKVDDEADRLDYEHMERGARTALQAVNLLAAEGFVASWAPGEPDLRRR